MPVEVELVFFVSKTQRNRARSREPHDVTDLRVILKNFLLY